MDLVVVVDVVHLEGEAEFFFARVQVSVLGQIAVRDRAESGQSPNKLATNRKRWNVKEMESNKIGEKDRRARFHPQKHTPPELLANLH